ncbi:hypothetical protein D3C73_1363910 [compost metagenome]
MAALYQLLFQHQTYGRGTLQGNKIQRQQVLPCDAFPDSQTTGRRDDGDKTIHPERGKMQVSGVVRFKGNPHLDPPFADHFNHLLVNYVVHRDIDTSIAVAKGLEHRRQHIRGK